MSGSRKDGINTLLETYEGLELAALPAAPPDQQLAHTQGSRKRVQASQGQARPKSQVKDQITELEQQLSSKMREALLLEQHNKRLKQRSHILELVIAARDKQVSTLRSLRHQTLINATLPANSNNTASSNGSHRDRHLSGHPVVGRVLSAVPNAPSGPLDPPNWVTLQLYSKLTLEQHMEAYTELVDILSSEMVKPGLGSTTEMMANLADFVRTVALMTDQLQLLVTRDVRGVQEAVMKALPPSSLNSLPALPVPPSNTNSTQEGEGCSINPQSTLGTAQPSGPGPSPGLVSEGGDGGSMIRASSAASMAASMGTEREGGDGGSQSAGRQESGGVSFSDIEDLIQQYGDTGNTELSLQQRQRGEQAIARYKSSLSGRVGAAIAKASNEVSDAHRPFSAWLARPIHRPSLPEQRARPWNVGLGMCDPANSNRRGAVKAAADDSNKIDPVALLEVWRSVARALDLSPQQRADSAMLLELHSDWMQSVEAQRTQLSQELSKVLYQKRYHTSNATDKIAEMNIIEALEKNLRSEHAILALVAEVFAFSILNMEQSAKALIHSWPHISDYVAIMQCAVADGQQLIAHK